MPITPVAGIPPQATLEQFERNPRPSSAPFFVSADTAKGNFYTQNGQVVLAAIVAIMLIIFFFVDTVGKVSTGLFF
jgi:hypothetical protein